jgi:hypothetical protein
MVFAVAEEGSFTGTAKPPWTRHRRDVRYENSTGVGGLVNNGEALKNAAVAGLERWVEPLPPNYCAVRSAWHDRADVRM